MENSSIILLVVSCAASFGIGRVIKHFLGKKRQREAMQIAMHQAEALRNRPPEAPSNNKAKRRRQMQQQSRDVGER